MDRPAPVRGPVRRSGVSTSQEKYSGSRTRISARNWLLPRICTSTLQVSGYCSREWKKEDRPKTARDRRSKLFSARSGSGASIISRRRRAGRGGSASDPANPRRLRTARSGSRKPRPRRSSRAFSGSASRALASAWEGVFRSTGDIVKGLGRRSRRFESVWPLLPWIRKFFRRPPHRCARP